ncbi:MAG TPA: DUF1622 domain-containing protein [Planctomycetaceae bacterium]
MIPAAAADQGPGWLRGLESHANDLLAATGLFVELVGVAVILGGAVYATGTLVRSLRSCRGGAYVEYRATLGRGILLGLEFLVAGDIIRTVAVEPDLESLAVLAGIVLIRTFLSFSLEVEITGRWPWRHGDEKRREL